MTAGPRGTIGAEQCGLEVGYGAPVQISVALAIARALEGVTDTVRDKGRSTNVPDAGVKKVPPCVRANRLVAGAANGEVTFLEGIRKDEGAPEIAQLWFGNIDGDPDRRNLPHVLTPVCRGAPFGKTVARVHDDIRFPLLVICHLPLEHVGDCRAISVVVEGERSARLHRNPAHPKRTPFS